jgi:hypothetical protein
LNGNAGTAATNFLGTTDNQALELRVDGQRAFRLEPNTNGAPNVLGGSVANSISPGTVGATIAGGGATDYFGNGYSNSIYSSFSTIGGGLFNGVGGDSLVCTIPGGFGNFVWPTNSGYATIGGGFVNMVQENSPYGTIGGGQANFINVSSPYGTIGGGHQNSTSGAFASIPGGDQNQAAANSFAAGHRAKADFQGDFVWADSSDFDFASSATNQFAVRCTGGAALVSAIDGSGNAASGVMLPAGSGSWSSLSDRSAKANFQNIDPQSVLARVAELPIGSWNYRAQDKSVRHIGPIAQDFYRAFQLGEDDKHISTVDADGVALASIQALNEIIEQKNARINDLEKRLARIEQLLDVQGGAKNEHPPEYK